MAKLLYIEASPRKKESASIAIAQSFLETYRKAHPQDEIVTIDLWQKELPHFDEETIGARYAIMRKQVATDAQRQAWQRVEEIIAEFKTGDKYLFSVPMWNFSIPYRLKHYIDILVQNRLTFTVTAQGAYQGLITGKPITLIYASSGAYGPETGAQQMDFQKPYLEMILGFMGFKDFQRICIERSLTPEGPQREAIFQKAREEAQKTAAQF